MAKVKRQGSLVRGEKFEHSFLNDIGYPEATADAETAFSLLT